MTFGSTSAFIFARMPEGRPARACAVSRAMDSRSPPCRSFGAVTRRAYVVLPAKAVSTLKKRVASSPNSGRHVMSPKSV